MHHYRGVCKYRGQGSPHITASCFLGTAKGQGSNPKLCTLAPEATLQSQPNSQLRGSHGQGRAELGTLPLLCDFFFCPVFGLFLFHLLHFSSFLMPLFIPSWLTRDTTQGKTAPKKQGAFLLRSIFKLCSDHCINYTKTVLYARLLIAVKIMN